MLLCGVMSKEVTLGADCFAGGSKMEAADF